MFKWGAPVDSWLLRMVLSHLIYRYFELMEWSRHSQLPDFGIVMDEHIVPLLMLSPLTALHKLFSDQI